MKLHGVMTQNLAISLTVPSIKWYRVHETFLIHIMLFNSPLVPYLIYCSVMDITKTPEKCTTANK
jgi:hypothetical protein